MGSDVDDTNIARGILQFKQGNFDAAQADFSEVLRAKPDTCAVLADLREAAAVTRDHTRAVKDYEAAIAIYPLDTTANCGLALLRASCPEADVCNGKEAEDLV